jgi:hypothetical protein
LSQLALDVAMAAGELALAMSARRRHQAHLALMFAAFTIQAVQRERKSRRVAASMIDTSKIAESSSTVHKLR